MVPNLSSAGYSFKGAFDYHKHDKDTLETSERVAWHTTRGLMTDDLETAERVMIATAYDADRLKEQAGIKATGRKSAKHVQTLSLAWHPDERVDQKEMECAADLALKELGLEDHQAVIIAHNDTDHQHLHIVVNRVNPNDGRLASMSNSKRKLDRWAHEYEKDRGRIVTPKRAEKYDRQREASERHPPKERRAYAERKRAETSQRRPDNRRADLASRQKALKDRHRQEWRDLKTNHREQRQQDYTAYRDRFKKTKDQHDKVDRENADKKRSEWRDLFKQQRESKENRKRMALSPTGRLALSVTAAREQRSQGSQENFARLTLANFISTKRREAVFSAVGDRDKAALSERQKFGRNKAFEHLRVRRADEIETQRTEQADARQELKVRQDRERDALRREWAELGNDRRTRGQARQRTDRGQDQQNSEMRVAERLRVLRDGRDDIRDAKPQKSAAERLDELRRSDRDRDSQRKARRDRGRDDPDFGL